MTNKRPDRQSWPVATGPTDGYVLSLALVSVALLFGACNAPTNDPASAPKKLGNPAIQGNSTQSAATSFVDGERAAKFIMRSHSTEGSFDVLGNTNGFDPTSSTAGGHKANRVFTPAGNLLADADIASWPTPIKWITNFEVAVTGSANLYSGVATDHDCARFATSADDGIATCDWDKTGTGTSAPCGAPDSYYRVSEKNCKVGATPIVGTGASTDNIFIRFEVDRSRLGSTENLMVVIEYAAANVNPAPENPTDCYNSTTSLFDPTKSGCSDQSWQLFMKKNPTDSVIPFLTLIPPALGHVDMYKHRGGANVATKQIILPIAADPELDFFQFSRMTSDPDASVSKGADTFTCPDNSALCHGTVFYSITIFRI